MSFAGRYVLFQRTQGFVVEAFVVYAEAHPEHLDERPMETVFRAVVDRWPCP